MTPINDLRLMLKEKTSKVNIIKQNSNERFPHRQERTATLHRSVSVRKLNSESFNIISFLPIFLLIIVMDALKWSL